MSEKTSTTKVDARNWTEKEAQEFISKLREQKVVVDELSHLKTDRKVYRQQPNSSIFFVADRSQTLSECTKTLDDMNQTYQEFQNTPKVQILK